MAESHVSSYENLKEIFAGHKQKLLNFFAKKSIYNDNQVMMKTNDATYANNKFIYNWYTPTNSTYDESKINGLSVVFGDHNAIGTNYTSHVYVIGSYNKAYGKSVDESYVYGRYNYIKGAQYSTFVGSSNSINYTEDTYTYANGYYCNRVSMFGNSNSINGNQRNALDTGSLIGTENTISFNKTSSTSYGSIKQCYLIGYKNNFDISTDGNNLSETLRDLYLSGMENNIKIASNSGVNAASICLFANGISNKIYNSRMAFLYGSGNRAGHDNVSNSNETSGSIYLFGRANYVGDRDQITSTTSMTHEQGVYGIGDGNKVDVSQNVSFLGMYNIAEGANTANIIGKENMLYGISNNCNVFGMHNYINHDIVQKYPSGIVTNAYIVGHECCVFNAENNFLFGDHLKSGYNNQFVTGIFNENNSNNYFEFGNGTDSDHRHNVAVITRSGDLILNDGDIINEDGESLTTIRTDIDLLDGRVETLEGKVEDLEDAVDNIEDDVEALGTRVGNNETDIETLQGQVRDLTLALADALSRITELENIVMNEKTNHVQLYTEDGDTRITEDGDNKFTEEVLTNG